VKKADREREQFRSCRPILIDQYSMVHLRNQGDVVVITASRS